MTYNGANGDTKTAMETTLWKDLADSAINPTNKSITNELLSADPNVIMEIANSIWYKKGLTVLPTFIADNQNYYNSPVNALDFSAPGSVDIINGWVSEKTHEKIKTILNEIPEDARMYLINAIYFKGTWLYKFDENATQLETFTLNDASTRQVKMMKQQQTFNYLSNPLFSAVEMPYGNGRFSMVVMVPAQDKSLNDLIAELNPTNWETWMESFVKEELVVHLPKFKFEFSNTLNVPLTNMGMGIAFDPLNADFSKITGYRDLYISIVLHKTFVDVNEAGTEAAAVTAVEISTVSLEGGGKVIPHFRVNKPFLFVIKEKETNALIFMGKMMYPAGQE